MLAQSHEDHVRMGSSGSGSPFGLRDPSKPEGENMNDDEIREFITKRISDVREQHQRTLADSSEKRFLDMFMNNNLIPDIEYLRHVGRLPKELESFDPVKEFHIP